MKKTKSIIVIGIVFVMSCAVTAFAQSRTIEIQMPMTTSVTGQVRVSIPFQFMVGDREFEAGDYYIMPISDKSLAIKAVDQGRSAVVLTNTVTTIGQRNGPRLIFHKYGARSFMAQMWASYSESGRELFASSEEVKLARVLSQQQITLLAAKK